MNSGRILLIISAVGMLLVGISHNATCAADTVSAPSTARLIVTCDLDGSTVFLDGSAAGITPLTLDSVAIGSHHLLVLGKNSVSWFRKADSTDVVLMPGETRQLKFSVLLPFSFAPGPGGANSPIVLKKNGTDGRTIGIWVSGGAAVAAGLAAAYFKLSADDRNDTYLRNGNAALLDERKRLDFAAGVALVFTQLGFILFSYFLLGE
jgi:hypothetical protein